MNHKVVNRDEWLSARKELLVAEKEHTRRGDALAKQRQALPWVRIDNEYQFDTDNGSASLSDLFCGRSQLLVYHFMLGPEYEAGCPSCSAIADSYNGVVVHLANHDVMFWTVSLASLTKIQAYKRRMGWTFPWASSEHTDFNWDFDVSSTEDEQQEGGIEYNFRRSKTAKERELDPILKSEATPDGPSKGATMCGTDLAAYTRQRPGMSAFVLEDGVVYHSYSAYSRGLDVLWNMYQWLDRAPKGRNETGYWLRHHDKYESENSKDDSCCHSPGSRI